MRRGMSASHKAWVEVLRTAGVLDEGPVTAESLGKGNRLIGDWIDAQIRDGKLDPAYGLTEETDKKGKVVRAYREKTLTPEVVADVMGLANS